MLKSTVLYITIAVIAVSFISGGIYLFNLYNPKGCVNLEDYNYPPIYTIIADKSYPTNSPQIAKITNVKNSCLAVIKAEDSSTDKCSAVTNLSETIYILAHNAQNLNDADSEQAIVDEIKSMQETIKNVDMTSCQEEFNELNKAFTYITKSFKPDAK